MNICIFFTLLASFLLNRQYLELAQYLKLSNNLCVRDAFKKKIYVDRETVPIPSFPPTIETVSEYVDSEYW